MSEEHHEFICECGFKFRCGIISLDRHTIYCPECATEIQVSDKISLCEFDCPALDNYLENKEEEK